MKTQFFKILGFNLYNDAEFWNKSIEIGKYIKDLNNINKSNAALIKNNLFKTREDELNMKIFHILQVLRIYKCKMKLPSNFWIGTRLCTRRFKNNRKLEYLSGDFDFLIGSLDSNSKPLRK
ncbi:MAG: hypothetical protein ACYCTB_11695 [bacterium]